MIPFQIVPKISLYETYDQFAAAFKLNDKDLVLTNEFIYSAGMKSAYYTGAMVFQERFGVGEPSDRMMDALRLEASRYQYDRIIAVGGGTVIDMAKLLALGGKGPTLQYFTGEIAPRKEKELIIIPTTCGTGSEMTNISILEIKEQNTKKGLANDALYADHAVLIPELLNSLPYKVFATSSIDALIHAAESFVAPESTQLSEVFSSNAIEMIIRGYKKIAAEGPDERKSLIKDFLLASTYAGIAFGNTGVGAVHAMSYPLGGVYHVPHGEANQQFFTIVFKAYKKARPQGKIAELESLLARLLEVPSNEVWDALDNLLEMILPRKPLQDYGMKEDEVVTFADSVIENQQRLLKNNYTALSRKQMIDIYTDLY